MACICTTALFAPNQYPVERLGLDEEILKGGGGELDSLADGPFSLYSFSQSVTILLRFPSLVCLMLIMYVGYSDSAEREREI